MQLEIRIKRVLQEITFYFGELGLSLKNLLLHSKKDYIQYSKLPPLACSYQDTEIGNNFDFVLFA